MAGGFYSAAGASLIDRFDGQASLIPATLNSVAAAEIVTGEAE
jgi:hypothetical protein